MAAFHRCGRTILQWSVYSFLIPQWPVDQQFLQPSATAASDLDGVTYPWKSSCSGNGYFSRHPRLPCVMLQGVLRLCYFYLTTSSHVQIFPPPQLQWVACLSYQVACLFYQEDFSGLVTIPQFCWWLGQSVTNIFEYSNIQIFLNRIFTLIFVVINFSIRIYSDIHLCQIFVCVKKYYMNM